MSMNNYTVKLLKIVYYFTTLKFKLSFKVVYKVMPLYFALIHSIGPLPAPCPFLFPFPSSPLFSPSPCWSSSSSCYLLKNMY